MDSFIDCLAAELLSKQQLFLNTIVVLPSNRAGLYLKEALQRKCSGTLLFPEITTINCIAEKFSSYTQMDPLTHMLESYIIYRAEFEDIDFRDYFKWCSSVLADFNELDLQMVDYDKFYRHLSSVNLLERWGVSGEELTENQKKYLARIKTLKEFHGKLLQSYQRNLKAGSGFIFRQATLAFDENVFSANTRFVFAGLNALSISERKLISKIKQNFSCEVYFLKDEFLMNDTQQESFHFIRNNAPLSTKDLYKSDLRKKEAAVKLIKTSGLMEQIQVASSELKAMNPEEISQTCIVLADASLLMPLTRGLPKNIGEFNITMGYELKNTPIYELFHIVFDLQKDLKNFRKFYHKNIIRLFSNVLLSSGLHQTMSDFRQKTQEGNKVFLSEAEILSYLPETLLKEMGLIFRAWDTDLSVFHSKAVALLNIIKTKLLNDLVLDDFMLECTYTFEKTFNQLGHYIEQYANSLKSGVDYPTLFEYSLRSKSISFEGEPIKGLQIMGILETRMLPFKNILYISADDEHLPASKPRPSFIPYDLRLAYHLPTYFEREAIYAHQFYSSLIESSSFTCIYSENGEKGIQNEASRYLKQIKHELSAQNPNLKFQEYNYTSQGFLSNSISIHKNEDYFIKLRLFLDSGISASALIAYYQCPLDFYYKYISRQRQNQLSEEVDGSLFGVICHEVLEGLYAPYKGQVLGQTDLENMIVHTSACVKHSFYANTGEKKTKGNNYLQEITAVAFIENFLKGQLQEIMEGTELKVLELENRVVREVKIRETVYTLKGTIDRLEIKNQTLRIIDYKTGKVDRKEFNVKKVNDREKLATSTKLLQSAFYMKLIQDKVGEVSMVSLNNGVDAGLNQKDFDESISGLLDDLLESFVAELQDEKIDFHHHIGSKYCEFCNY